MNHKCEYCGKGISPCSSPCLERNKQDHVCCTCKENDSTGCELPVRIVCDNNLCNLKYSVDYYKNRLDELKAEVKVKEDKIVDLVNLINEWRLVNVGSPNSNIIDIINKGALSIPSIKVFVAKQKLTWDRFPVDIGYTIMCLHEEFLNQWQEWIHKRAVKVTIKKDLINETEAKLAKARKTREGIANNDGSLKSEKQVKVTLNPYEKIVLHNMTKLKMTQDQAETFTKSMGLNGEARNLHELGLV